MARQFTNIAFTPSVKKMQTRYGSREVYTDFAAKGVTADTLSNREIEFIQARDSFYLGTSNSDDWPYIQFRGGSVGFLRVIDESTLGFADFRGNLQYVSVGNLVDNDRVFLFLMDYTNRRRLKIWGRAEVVEHNPELLEQLTDTNYEAQIERAIIIKVQAINWNCPQHIPLKYSEAEVAAKIAPLEARIRELETKLAKITKK